MQMSQQDWVLAQRAETLRLSGVFGQARRILKELKSQKNYEDNPWINAHLGTIYRQLMDYKEAEKLLLDAIKEHKEYFWAHAQLGETYRLWAIVENRNKDYVKASKTAFKNALFGKEFDKEIDAVNPKQSNYAWALAHLGATYRLEMTSNIDDLIANEINETSKQEALKCLDRAIELIPTYTWAWGMRATVYRLAQEYENSLWDLAVETVISQETEVLHNSSSPISGLDSRRSNLHEHAMLAYYLTKTNKKGQQDNQREEQKDRNYDRAIAYAQKALILNPGDQVAQLMLVVIRAHRKKERLKKLSQQDIGEIKEQLKDKFLIGREPAFFNQCKNLLRYLVSVGRVSQQELKDIRHNAGEESLLAEFVLEDLITEGDKEATEKKKYPDTWLWRNFALTQTCASVMMLLGDLSFILKVDQVDDSYMGKAGSYYHLALKINAFDTLERIYQTPTMPEGNRTKELGSLKKLASLSGIITSS